MTACVSADAAGGQHRRRNSDSLQVCGRGLALLAAFQVEAELLTLIQCPEASALHGRDVNEHVLRAVVRLNEAESLLRVEPLNRALRHRISPCNPAAHTV